MKETLHILRVLLLFCATEYSAANVYSCEQMHGPLLDLKFSQTYACVIPQEDFTRDFTDQLEQLVISAGNVRWPFTNLANGPIHCCEKDPKYEWEITHNGNPTIDCYEKFAFVLFDQANDIILPNKKEDAVDVKGAVVFIVAQSGMYIRTESCKGSGNIVISTGTVEEEDDNKFEFRSWTCATVPEWVFVYDVGVTIQIDDDVVYSVRYSSDLTKKTTVSAGDRIVILSSGRTNDFQNLQGIDHGTNFEMISGQFNDASVNMDLTFDSTDNGYLTLMKSPGDLLKRYYNGTHTEQFTTDYFEVRYTPTELKPDEISRSNDAIIVEISIAAQDGYCNCGVDKLGFPDGWKPSEIWLDIIFILDTTEAMGEKELKDAGAVIESFLNDGSSGILSTDTNANFYTRIGVISMSDSAKVIYNLNMTSSDKIQGKVSITSGVQEMIFADAFEAAQNMFEKGLKDVPERSKTRQVVHFMTASTPDGDLTNLKQFKSTQGVVIVNDYGKGDNQQLKSIASDTYYFSDVTYMQGLQAFCKANCYCKLMESVTYGKINDAVSSADESQLLIIFNSSYRSGVSFKKASETCSADGGILASVHNNEKGRFLQQMMKSNFWIGYSKSDDGVWQWQDKSTDSYTNWGENEPGPASDDKCAYVDSTDSVLPWSATNCQTGLSYACQYPMCSVGNKNCMATPPIATDTTTTTPDTTTSTPKTTTSVTPTTSGAARIGSTAILIAFIACWL